MLTKSPTTSPAELSAVQELFLALTEAQGLLTAHLKKTGDSETRMEHIRVLDKIVRAKDSAGKFVADQTQLGAKEKLKE